MIIRTKNEEDVMIDWKTMLSPNDPVWRFVAEPFSVTVGRENNIRKLLKKRGVDEMTILRAVMAYNYFRGDERIRKQLAKLEGRTVEEMTKLYDAILMFCCRYKEFAELIVVDKKKAAEVNRMAVASVGSS